MSRYPAEGGEWGLLARRGCHMDGWLFGVCPDEAVPADHRDAHRSLRSGVTLVEVLAVISIIAVLIALLFPALQAARESTRRVTCSNNIRQFALALQSYHQSDRALPSGIINQNRNHPQAFTNSAWQAIATPDTWFAEILPQLDEQTRFDRFDFSKRSSDPVNSALVMEPMAGVACPSDSDARTSVCTNRCRIFTTPQVVDRMLGLWYAGSAGINPILSGCMCCSPTTPATGSTCCSGSDRGFWTTTASGTTSTATGMFAVTAFKVTFDSVRDGLSTTILLGETLPHENMHNGAFTTHYPVVATNIPINRFVPENEWPVTGVHLANYSTASGIKSRHPRGAQVAMADGSVHFFTDDMDFVTLRMLGTRRGNEIVSLP